MMKKGKEIATIDVELVTIVDLDGNEIGFKTASKINVNPVIENRDAIKLIVKDQLIAQKPSRQIVSGNTIVLTDNVFIPEVVQILQGGEIVFGKNYTYTAADAVIKGPYYIVAGGEYISFTLADDLAAGNTIVYNDVTGILILTVGASSSYLTYTVSSSIPNTGTALTVVAAPDESHVKSYSPPANGEPVVQEPFTLCAYSAVRKADGTIPYYEKITYPSCRGVPVNMSSEDDVFRVPEYTINSTPDTGALPYKLEYIPRLPEFES